MAGNGILCVGAEVGGGIIFATPRKFCGFIRTKLYMLASVGRPSLHGYYACVFFGLRVHFGEIAGKSLVIPLFLLIWVFLFSRNSLVRL